MSSFGGTGGVWDGREVNKTDLFEVAINETLGYLMRSDDDLCKEVWCALANTGWRNLEGDDALYSYRAAGDLVAAIKGTGMYTDWYCCGIPKTISERVEIALNSVGWFHDESH